MGVNWAAGLIHWKPHIGRDGKARSLAHLHPFRFTVHLEAHRGQPVRTVVVHVGFALHVFTCAIADAGADPELYSDNRETRAFDLERYRWSLKLEAIVKGLERRPCYFAKNANFLTLEFEGLPAGHEYQVFFDVRRRDADGVELIVQSAYANPMEAFETKRQKIRFHIIVAKALLGKKPKPPP